MTLDLVDRLLTESALLPADGDPAHQALRWAILVEDVLGIVLSDEQITSGRLTDPVRLRSLVSASPPPG